MQRDGVCQGNDGQVNDRRALLARKWPRQSGRRATLAGVGQQGLRCLHRIRGSGSAFVHSSPEQVPVWWPIKIIDLRWFRSQGPRIGRGPDLDILGHVMMVRSEVASVK